MTALAFLKPFWKEILLAVLAGLLAWRLWSAVTGYGEEQYDAGYAAREAEYAAARIKTKDDHIAEIRRQEKANNEIVTDLQARLDAISARPAGPPVWMCKQPASVPGTAGSTSGVGTAKPDETTQGGPSGEVRDIGPGTRAIVDDGDRAIEQLTGLQFWVESNCLKPASRQK